MCEHLRTALQDLVAFIEERNIEDEIAIEDEGHVDIWRSSEFEGLITKAKAALREV